MRTARKPVQRADGKSRVRVPVMRLRFVVLRRMLVNMGMDVMLAMMFVLMHVNIVFERAAQRPKTDAEKHHADDAVAPLRNQIHRQTCAQPQRQKPNDRDARRMAESPTHTGNPCGLGTTHRQRRDGRQMVRPRQHVNEAGD